MKRLNLRLAVCCVACFLVAIAGPRASGADPTEDDYYPIVKIPIPPDITLDTMAVAAGLRDWGSHYASWNASGINAISNFVEGAGSFLEALWLPTPWAQAIVAVLAISFAATSMEQ